jgi:hypothetical protein
MMTKEIFDDLLLRIAGVMVILLLAMALVVIPAALFIRVSCS